eukprot:TRINITY_DN4839_c0_g1_i4.p1 TRINITY_DN4839_c0_g1~~TRINITY_DN4839_c0_g1_i4.p1  ORF type:complete len:174 (+),score=46.50 TRINITY_DN4839_c0_g1_i4:143-664(+)
MHYSSRSKEMLNYPYGEIPSKKADAVEQAKIERLEQELEHEEEMLTAEKQNISIGKQQLAREWDKFELYKAEYRAQIKSQRAILKKMEEKLLLGITQCSTKENIKIIGDTQCNIKKTAKIIAARQGKDGPEYAVEFIKPGEGTTIESLDTKTMKEMFPKLLMRYFEYNMIFDS